MEEAAQLDCFVETVSILYTEHAERALFHWNESHISWYVDISESWLKYIKICKKVFL